MRLLGPSARLAHLEAVDDGRVLALVRHEGAWGLIEQMLGCTGDAHLRIPDEQMAAHGPWWLAGLERARVVSARPHVEGFAGAVDGEVVFEDAGRGPIRLRVERSVYDVEQSWAPGRRSWYEGAFEFNAPADVFERFVQTALCVIDGGDWEPIVPRERAGDLTGLLLGARGPVGD